METSRLINAFAFEWIARKPTRPPIYLYQPYALSFHGCRAARAELIGFGKELLRRYWRDTHRNRLRLESVFEPKHRPLNQPVREAGNQPGKK